MKRKPTDREIEIQRTLMLLEITKGKTDAATREQRTELFRKLASLGYIFREAGDQKYEIR